MLFNEPKLLKSPTASTPPRGRGSFSALQRAEIAEIIYIKRASQYVRRFSALQRAEIAEIGARERGVSGVRRFQCSSTSRNC